MNSTLVTHIPHYLHISQFCDKSFAELRSYATIQDRLHRAIAVDGRPSHIDIFDTSGGKEYDILTEELTERADAFIIAYSMVDTDSYTHACSLFHRIMKAEGPIKPVVLVATQADIAYARNPMVSRRCSLAVENGCEYFQCSAKTGFQVEAPFIELVRALRNSACKGKGK